VKNRKIHFIITGGTIDKSYNPPDEKTILNKRSIVPLYLQDIIKPHFKTVFQTVCMLDSQDITPALRNKILQTVKKSKSNRIIITHGTNTMTKTADFLKKNLGSDNQKIIVLTGSMIPLKEFLWSDGAFNLGQAIGAIEFLKPGVYIAMNGQVFKAGKVRKNFKKARFESLS
jgi:L-asparaginase